MESSKDEIAAAGTPVQACVEPGAKSGQFGSAAAREARKSRPHQFVEAYESGGGIAWKHAHREAVPFGEAEWPARPHGHVRESELSSQLGKHTFHKVALSCRSSAGGDQEIRPASRPLEHRREGGTIIWGDACIARFSAGGQHECRERNGIAVAHLAARWRSRHIHELVTGANDGDQRTPECAHRGSAGESQECQLPWGQNLTC
jgi:hypothetical protein